jgi:hypothetical protein
MSKKIQVDIPYLKSIGISNSQIREIVKKAEPNHWTNRLPQDAQTSFSLFQILIDPEIQKSNSLTVVPDKDIEPTISFFNEQDAVFVSEKCKLLIEMSNYAFSVNEDWFPDWSNKDQKKFGIVIQNGVATLKENELFNIFAFGIVVKNKGVASEMLEEFKTRIETFFNKSFNSILKTEPNTERLFDFDDVSIQKKKRKYLVPTDVPKIQEMLIQGMKQKEIAEQLGYSSGLISRVKGTLGFVMRKRRSVNQNNP